MAEFIIECIVNFFTEVVFMIIELPGAYIHWRLRKKRIPLKEIKQCYFGINLLISLLVYTILITIIFIS